MINIVSENNNKDDNAEGFFQKEILFCPQSNCKDINSFFARRSNEGLRPRLEPIYAIVDF